MVYHINEVKKTPDLAVCKGTFWLWIEQARYEESNFSCPVFYWTAPSLSIAGRGLICAFGSAHDEP